MHPFNLCGGVSLTLTMAFGVGVGKKTTRANVIFPLLKLLRFQLLF